MSLSGIIGIIEESLKFAIPCLVIWFIIRGVIIYRGINNKKIKFKNKSSKKERLIKEVILDIFVFYLLILYGITVYRYGIDFGNFFDLKGRLYCINTSFLKELIKMISYGSIWHVFYNVVGNIIWFIPLGFLIPIIWEKKRQLGTIIGLSFITSLSIEVLQFIFRTGISDIDDLVFNTLGGIIGYIIFKVGQGRYKKLKNSHSKYNKKR